MFEVKVKFNEYGGVWSRTSYSYLSEEAYDIGDLVLVPARDHYAVVKVVGCSDRPNLNPSISYKSVISKFNPNKVEEKSMNINRKFIDRMFRQVDNVVWDLMSGNVGFTNKDGIVTIDIGTVTEENEAPDAQVSVNMFDDFGISIPAFAQSVPADSIKVGDMIYGAGNPLGWVVKKNEKSFKLMKPDGTRSDWTPPKTQMIGFDSGVMVLRNLINMFPGGGNDLNNFQSMLMPMMMMGGNVNDLIPIMLMGQVTGGSATTNNMMMPLMLMSMMGKGGNSPFAKLGGNGFFDGGNK